MPTGPKAAVLVSKADWSHAQPNVHSEAPNDGQRDSFPLAASDFSNMLVHGSCGALDVCHEFSKSTLHFETPA